MKVAAETCPCGSGESLLACCGRHHAGTPAPDAEKLMRSRYSAFVLGLTDYLLATWHPDTRPGQLDLAAGPRTQWLGLTVKAHVVSADDRATVEFVARYKQGGRAFKLHETSRFVRIGECWFYLDGDVA